MSTNAHIGIYRGKNKVEFIYLHWDGYPSYALEMLKEHYKNREKVEKLIALGDISYNGYDDGFTTVFQPVKIVKTEEEVINLIDKSISVANKLINTVCLLEKEVND